MSQMNRRAVLAAGAVLPLTLSACGGGDSTETGDGSGGGEIRIAHYFAVDHHQNVALQEVFKPMVEDNTDLTVEIFPDNQLGAETQYTNDLRSGTIQMAVAGMGLQTDAPKLSAAEWPFIFEDFDHVQAVLDGDIGDELAQEFSSLGLEHLAWTANGFRAISSNRLVESMEDFRGLRLRMPDIPVYVSTGQALGASVQPMAISEIFTALEQGVIDGQDNPIATLRASGWHEVQSHLLESRHMFSPNVYLMNSDFWNGLSEDDQAAVQEAATAASERQWELARESVDEDKAFLEEEGMVFTTPDESFRQAMIEAVGPVYEDLYAQYEWAEDYAERIRTANE